MSYGGLAVDFGLGDVIACGMHLEDRLARFRAAGLYVVTSEDMSAGRSTTEIVAGVLKGGGRLIQLREKEMARDSFIELARESRRLTAAVGAILIINDHVDVAVEVGADGVHLGQDDMGVAEARERGPDLIIGVSIHDESELRAAEAAGATTVNIGPLFPTETKDWQDEYLGLEGLKMLGALATVPFTVMGGIKECHIPGLVAAGAETIALVTAVTQADVPAEAVKRLLGLIQAERVE